MSIASSKAPPPVTTATVCMGISIGAGLAKAAIFTAHWERPATMLGFPLVCLILLLLLRALYRGRRWAFWCVVPITALGLYYAPDSVAKMASKTDQVMFIVQAVLQAVAVICLILPSSRQWFFPKSRGTISN